MEILIQVTLMVVGFIMLIKGADWFVDGAAGIAAKMGIPQLIIGLTIVAMGTSAPEPAVSISSAIKGNADICIGNVVGSNILNVLIILGITATIVELKVAKSTIRYEIPYMIFITIVLLIMGYTGNKVTLLEGAILWALFILYLAYLFVMARKNNSDDEYQRFIDMLLKRSSYNFNSYVNENDNIVTLSTCYNNSDKLVVHAKLIKKEKRKM